MRVKLIFILVLFYSSVFSQAWMQDYEKFFLLVQEQKYDDATIVGISLSAALENVNKTDTAYCNVTYYMSQIFFSKQEYNNAAIWSGKQRNALAKWVGTNNLQYIAATYFHGICYGYNLDYETCLPFMEEAYLNCNKNLGENHPYSLHYSNQYAHTLNSAGSFHKADGIFTNNWNIVQNHYQPTDSMYMVVANAVSQFYTTTGNYTKSEPFFLNALAMLEKQFGKNSQQYYETLEQTRQFYLLAKWFDKAEKTYLDILNIFEKSAGKDSKDYYQLFDATGQFYIEIGSYEKAQKIYESLLSIAEKTFGKKSADYATALNNVAVTLEKQGKFVEAEKMYLKCLDIKAQVFKQKSGYYALSLLNLSVLYDNMGKYDKAEKYASDALNTYEAVYGSQSLDYANALANAGTIFSSAGKSTESIKMLEKSISIFKAANKYESTECLTALNNLASIHVDLGNYIKAEKEFEELINLREKVQGKDHTDLGIAIFNLANLKTELGHYSDAEKLLDRAFTIQKTALGINHVTCANIKQSMASVYSLTGRYTMAEKMYDECDRIYQKTIGKLHPEYAIYLGNRGLFYFQKGDFEKSRNHYERAISIHYDAYGQESEKNIPLIAYMGHLELAKDNFKAAEKHFTWCVNKSKTSFGEKHPDYAVAINNLANLYYELGNYSKSQELYELALALRKDIYGDKHREYAISLNNLGTVFMARANASKDPQELKNLSLTALIQFKKALIIDSLIYGIDNIEISSNLNNLAEVYRIRNEPEKAEELYKRSIAIEQKSFGEHNIRTAVTYHNLGLMYLGKNELKKAEENISKSIEMFDKKLGSGSPNSIDANSSLAYVYDLQGNDAKANKQYLFALELRQQALERNFTFLSEEEKEKLLTSVNLYQNQYTAFALKTKEKNNAITATVYTNELKNKGALLRSSERMKNIVLNSGNAELINLYANWSDVKQQLSVAYSTPIDNRIIDIKTLEEQGNELEKKLVSSSSDLKNEITETNVTYKDLQQKLLPGQAAIEFIHFTKENSTGEEVYCALLLKKDTEYPEMIELFVTQKLISILGEQGANNLKYVSDVYNQKGKLYETIWAPLEKHLNGISEIYYTPSGLLHKLSLASIRNTNGKYLSEIFQLHMLNSTASILQKNDSELEPVKAHISMFGGINYDTDKTKNPVWKYLPGTMSEAKNINSILIKGGMLANAFTGMDATETHLKDLDGKNSPEILHIATHGFFFSDPEETKKKIHVETTDELDFRGGARGTTTLIENSNPLMRSGIVLAGANDVWNENNTNKEDGVLTAYEVSLLNLQNTKLAVLSACETGLGDIKGSEGVYGLQRAFRIAGVQKLIMSLWQVPDKETEEFMVLFYSNLLKLKNIDKAFAQTQKVMRSKYDPYFWGAFVLIE
jgi:CHAT domain-containing protein